MNEVTLQDIDQVVYLTLRRYNPENFQFDREEIAGCASYTIKIEGRELGTFTITPGTTRRPHPHVVYGSHQSTVQLEKNGNGDFLPVFVGDDLTRSQVEKFNNVCDAIMREVERLNGLGEWVELVENEHSTEKSASETHSLQRQLADARENLRVIEEHKAQYVREVDIPLQDIKDERRLKKQITQIEEQLEASGSSEKYT
jgi:hypothetical protein